MPAFDEAFNAAYNSRLRRAQFEADQADREERRTWEREDRGRVNADRTRVDQAFNDYESLSKNGKVNAEGTGLSAPSAQMAFAGNAGYGDGAAAVQEMSGDYAREMARFAQKPGAPAGGLPTYNPQAAVTTTAATEVEKEEALGRIAAARRDERGIRESRNTAKAMKVDEGRRAEFKRLQGMKPGEIADIFKEQNKDGSGFPGMLKFDEKANKFLFTSDIPGVPSQSLSRAELMQQMMGLWEAGNGDYAKGLDMMVQGAKAQRELDDKQYTRTAGVAQGNADLFWKGRGDERMQEQLRISRGHLGVAQGREARESYQLINPQTNYRVGEDGQMEPVTTGLRWNRQSGAYDPVSQDMGSQRGLIPAGVLDQKNYITAAKEMVESGAIAGTGADRKPVPHTMQTAIRALMDENIARYRGQGQDQGFNGRKLPGQGGGPGGPAAQPQAPETTRGPNGETYWRMPGEAQWRSGSPSASTVRDMNIDRTLNRGLPAPGVMALPGEGPDY